MNSVIILWFARLTGRLSSWNMSAERISREEKYLLLNVDCRKTYVCDMRGYYK